MSLDLDADLHPSLAMGTRDAEEFTKVESPSGRVRTQPPPERPDSLSLPLPEDDDANQSGMVLGSYRLVELLGKGGMGFVYRAEHVKLGRAVALKLLRTDYARRREAVMRFFQEAKTVNRVRHRNIVDVTDFVELDDGTTFIIMELLAGTSLGRWARSGVDLPRALAVLVQICDGLGAAHAVGVVHRDLKPDNIVVVPTSDGAELVKLLDFGVAKLVNRDDEDVGFVTAAGSVIGTPAYMSPEQAGGMLVDHRSDIYSLGAIMYELFCGQPMFKGRSFGEYVRKHLTEQPVPPRQTANGAAIDERLEQLIMRCLAKDPNERFGHILELRDGLLHMLGGLDTHPPSYVSASAMRSVPTQLPGMPAVPHVPTQPTPMSASQVAAAYGSDVVPPAPTVPWWTWVVGGACAIGLGIIAAVWYAGRADGPGADVAPPPRPTSSAPLAPAAPAPAAAPIAPPAPQLVELRFDSLPSGSVYADGRSAELCTTPCTFNVDLHDGGPIDKRTFVVRRDDYKDGVIVVDLAAAPREFHVTLERLVPSSATAPTPPVADHPTRPTRPSRAGNGKPTKKPDKPTVDKPIEPPAVPPPPDKPAVDKPADKKPTKIDPTDTLDPFHRRDPSGR